MQLNFPTSFLLNALCYSHNLISVFCFVSFSHVPQTIFSLTFLSLLLCLPSSNLVSYSNPTYAYIIYPHTVSPMVVPSLLMWYTPTRHIQRCR